MKTPVTLAKAVWNFVMDRGNYLSRSLDSTNRDLNKECGYLENPTVHDFKSWYNREGLATRIVNLFPDETWAVVPEMYEVDDNRETPFEIAWNELVDKADLNPWHYLHRIDQLSGIGRYGCLLLGFSDGRELNEPVRGLNENGSAPVGRPPKTDLIYLRTFDETVATVVALEDDKSSPRFGQPSKYELVFANEETSLLIEGDDGTNEGSSMRGDAVEVHWTRILHVADNRTTCEWAGTPRLMNVINRCHDTRKVLGGSAEMFWKGGFPGYSVESLPDLVDEGELDQESVSAEFKKFMNGLQRYLALEGVTVKSLAPQVADPEKHIYQQLLLIALTIGCPLRVLMGAETGQLASEQDTARWNRRVGRRQLEYVNPMIIRPFVQRLMDVGVLPKAQAKIAWQDLNSLTEKDKADIALKTAQALLQYVTSGAEKVMPFQFFLTEVLRYTVSMAEAIVKEAKNAKTYLTEDLWKKAGAQLPGSGSTGTSQSTGQNGVGVRGKRNNT